MHARRLALFATLSLLALSACEGRFATIDRGLARTWADAGVGDAGSHDAGRIVLSFDRDAALADTGVSDASVRDASVRDAAVRDAFAPDAWMAPPPSCSPSCAGRECGSDGCGGSCGSCSGSETCSVSQQCVPSTPPGGTHAVTMYGASWCGACAAGRAFFMANGVTYTYRNAEDPTVQSEMLSRAAMLGYPLGPSIALPVLVIDSTMTEGWSEGRARGQLGL